MSGAPVLSPRALGPINRRSLRAVTVAVGVAAVVAVLVLGSLLGTGAIVPAKGSPAGLTPTPLSRAVTPAAFSVQNLSANNTTVDVSMAFNVSVLVNLSGLVQYNTSNFTFDWHGLPAFVSGTPGSGCSGALPENNSSVLNCTAASVGSLTISVTVTNWTNAQVNSSANPATLTIAVNPIPSITSFIVGTSDHTSVAVNTTITFTVAASGGTGGLTYGYNGLPLGCSSAAASFSCTPNRAGIYNVTVIATDSYGFSSSMWNVTVTVTAPTPTTTSSGIGTTGWAIVIGILVVGFLVTIALLVQARREERAGRMGMEEATHEPSGEAGGTPPMGGSPPPPPSS